MTTHNLMALVAIVAVALGVAVWRIEGNRRATVRYLRAEEHAKQAGVGARNLIDLRYDQRKAYHLEMMRKWWQAAKHPWSPVEPDPPEPK